MRRAELERHLGELLRPEEFDDEALNGLQIEGRENIRRAAVAVSACAEAFSKAAESGVDALIVHHGLLWKGRWPEPIRGVMRGRLAMLLRSKINLFAYHLPLDAHPELGNNAVAARDLGFRDLEPFGEYRGRKIGFKGVLADPAPRDELLGDLEEYYGHGAFAVPGGPATVRTAGFLSGGAAWEATQAIRERLDLFVTGEPAEGVTYICREEGLNFAALGHYATERVGVRALADHLSDELGIETYFIELENEA